MQVLPSLDAIIPNAIIPNQDTKDQAAKTNSSFTDILNSAQQSVHTAVDATMNVVRDEVQPTQNFFGDKEARFGVAELNQLRETLKKSGVSQGSLESINEILASGNMPTLGQVYQSFRNGGSPVEMSDGEQKNVLSALQKMGFSSDEAAQLQGLMADGKGKNIFKMISERINNMGANSENTELFADEMSALVKGLGGSNKALSGLASLFAGSESLNLDALGLKTALAGLAEEITKKIADEKTLAKNLKSALLEASEQIKAREKQEALSDKRSSKSANNAEFFMRDRVTAKVTDTTGAAELAGKKDTNNASGNTAANAHLNATQWANSSHDALANQDLKQEQKEQAQKELKNAKNKNEAPLAVEKSSKTETATSTISDLFSKVEAAPSALNALNNHSNNNAATFAKNSEGMRPSAFHEAIFSQIDQGLLQKINNGASQLVLRLDPGDLGQVTMLVSVHQGEVKATLRAENAEAAQSLQDQIPRMQALLEGQGFKVQKLDVQTQLSDGNQQNDSNSSQWQGLAQHNASQERQQELLREMIGRNASGNAFGKNGLAQDMQYNSKDQMSAAEISRLKYDKSSLYIVA